MQGVHGSVQTHAIHNDIINIVVIIVIVIAVIMVEMPAGGAQYAGPSATQHPTRASQKIELLGHEATVNATARSGGEKRGVLHSC